MPRSFWPALVQAVTTCCSPAARLRGNGERMRKWREIERWNFSSDFPPIYGICRECRENLNIRIMRNNSLGGSLTTRVGLIPEKTLICTRKMSIPQKTFLCIAPGTISHFILNYFGCREKNKQQLYLYLQFASVFAKEGQYYISLDGVKNDP